MPNICALNYSKEFLICNQTVLNNSWCQFFFRPKTPKLSFLLLLRWRSFLLLWLLLLLSSSFATEGPSTRIQARFPPLSPAERGLISQTAAGNRANTWYDVRSLLFMASQTLLPFENCSLSYCLLSPWRRFNVFKSCRSFVSSYCFLRVTTGLSSCREIFLSL